MDNFAIPIPLNVSAQNHTIPLNAEAVPTGTSDYNHLINRPSLNGVVIEGDHDSGYYDLYSMPETGIPKTDLASGVQESLDKADTALQEDDLEELTEEVDDLKSAFDTGIFVVNKSLSWNPGYVSTSGTISNSSTSIFTLVNMEAGETVKIHTFNQWTSIISSTTAQSVSIGDSVTPIRISQSGSVTDFEYTASESINLVLCVTAASYTCEFTKDSEYFKGIESDISDIKYDIKLRCDISGTIQTPVYDSEGQLIKIEHTSDGSVVRTDAFTYSGNVITETRTLSNGKTLAYIYNLETNIVEVN